SSLDLTFKQFAQVAFRREMRPIAFVDPGAYPESAANFCTARRSGGISTIVSGRSPRTWLLGRVDGSSPWPLRSKVARDSKIDSSGQPRCPSKSDLSQLSQFSRGRDDHHWSPPLRSVRALTSARGSYLGSWRRGSTGLPHISTASAP